MLRGGGHVTAHAPTLRLCPWQCVSYDIHEYLFPKVAYWVGWHKKPLPILSRFFFLLLFFLLFFLPWYFIPQGLNLKKNILNSYFIPSNWFWPRIIFKYSMVLANGQACRVVYPNFVYPALTSSFTKHRFLQIKNSCAKNCEWTVSVEIVTTFEYRAWNFKQKL